MPCVNEIGLVHAFPCSMIPGSPGSPRYYHQHALELSRMNVHFRREGGIGLLWFPPALPRIVRVPWSEQVGPVLIVQENGWIVKRRWEVGE